MFKDGLDGGGTNSFGADLALALGDGSAPAALAGAAAPDGVYAR